MEMASNISQQTSMLPYIWHQYFLKNKMKLPITNHSHHRYLLRSADDRSRCTIANERLDWYLISIVILWRTRKSSCRRYFDQFIWQFHVCRLIELIQSITMMSILIVLITKAGSRRGGAVRFHLKLLFRFDFYLISWFSVGDLWPWRGGSRRPGDNNNKNKKKKNLFKHFQMLLLLLLIALISIIHRLI